MQLLILIIFSSNIRELCLDVHFIDCNYVEDDDCNAASNDHDVDIEIIEVMNPKKASYFYYDNSTIMEHSYGENSQHLQDPINCENKSNLSVTGNFDVHYKNKGVKRRRGKKRSELFFHRKKKRTGKTEKINGQIIKTEPSEEIVATRKYRFYCSACEITYPEFSEESMKKCPQCNTKIMFQCNCCAKVFHNRYNVHQHSEKMYKIALLARVKTEREESICEELKKNPAKLCTKPNLIKVKQEPVKGTKIHHILSLTIELDKFDKIIVFNVDDIVSGVNEVKVKKKKYKMNGVTKNTSKLRNPMFKVLIKEWIFHCKPCDKSYRKYRGKDIHVCPKCSNPISFRCGNCKRDYNSRQGAATHGEACFKHVRKENKRRK